MNLDIIHYLGIILILINVICVMLGFVVGFRVKRAQPNKRINDLLKANTKYLLRAREGEELLRECKAQFKFYEHSHLEKNTEDSLKKAAVNAAFYQKIKQHLIKMGVSA